MATSEISLETEYSDRLQAEKYRDAGQSFEEHAATMAVRMSDDNEHCDELYRIFSSQKFLPAGRVQAAMGAKEREVSAFNCSVSRTIEDDMSSIMAAATESAKILRLGTGVGYNFSRLRPKGALIKSLQTEASGPVSFMRIFEAVASTIASSGHRRGAQMAVLNVSHPDIEEFIDAKLVKNAFRHFNISVGITDDFIAAVEANESYDLHFNGVVYKTVSAADLWQKIMRNAFESAEPGVLYLDRINQWNNLYYCEYIDATNPCAEQCLPPHGLCLLGSFNLTQYVTPSRKIDYDALKSDIPHIVRAYDNIFNASVYAIPEHEREAKAKRRMGLGYTGIANAVELVTGEPYGSEAFCAEFEKLAILLRDEAYRASCELAAERGPFKNFSVDYCDSEFVKTLPELLQRDIREYGIRNSHLLSYAPCGTISQIAGNVSSGVEPVFFHSMDREVHMKSGKIKVTLQDYNVKNHKFYGRTLNECSVSDHISVARIAQKYCDSSVSKTVNVAADCTYEEYEGVYREAFHNNMKGVTVFRPTELRGAVITDAAKPKKRELRYGETQHCENGACSI